MATGRTQDARTPRHTRGKVFAIGIVLVVLGALLVVYLGWRGGLAESPRPTFGLKATIEESSTLEDLKTQLAEEIRERQALSDRIAELDTEFSRMRLSMRESEESRETSAREDSIELDDMGEEVQSEFDAGSENARFDDEKLLSLGIPADEVERLRERWVRHELDTATIADRALREGWFLQAQHSTELRHVDRQLREDLEEEEYDRYLYAVGKPNRLRAGEVFAGSSAGDAGLLRGDVILRYDDKRIFRRGELLVAASQGAIGESVAMEILRNGHLETIYIERGPFGAILDETQGAPLGN